MILSCQNITKSFGEDDILRGINFNIEKNDKCAVIGINGAGKTTLLKVITGEYAPDTGNVSIARDVRIGYLSQTQDTEEGNTIYGVMQEAKSYIIEMEERLRTIEVEMKHAEGSELEKLLEDYNRISTHFDRENGYAFESEITGVIKGLGFSTEDYDRSISTLSGGQKMRVALGRLLLSRPDIILLDEPTNHLDIASTTWLEGYLASYPGAVIVVSHDRYFIDKVTNKIIELDKGISTVFNGSYSYYSEEKKKIRQAELNAYLKQQAEIQHEEAVITKLKQFNREKSIKRAESREKKLEKIEVLDKPTEVRSDMRIKLEPICESGNDVLVAEGVSKSFGDNTLFSDAAIDIKRGEHVALIGGNGVGKTTLLKILSRKLAKDGGQITFGAKVKVGYFDQEHHDLNPENTLFEEMADSFPDMNNTRIRNVLAAFLFTGEDVFKKIGDLSGGERGRLSLAKLMLSPANFLILDEPTNHLDIPSKEILEDALSDYTGTVLYVSHDRYFVNRTASRIIELRDTVLTSYEGNYDYFEENRDRIFYLQHPELASADNGAGGSSSSGLFGNSGSNSGSRPASEGRLAYEEEKARQAEERKKANRIAKLEELIDKAETEINDATEQMNDPANGTNMELLLELSKKTEELNKQLEEYYEEWETLQS